MNRITTVIFLGTVLNLYAQLPHGFSWSSNGKKAVCKGFETEVRSSGTNLCFETNVLIIRDANQRFQQLTSVPTGLIPHDFIPNLYTYQSQAKSLEELVHEKELWESTFQVEVFYNQVFTLNAATNDPNYNRQWAIENTGGPLHYNGTSGADMEVVPAWNLSKGQGVKVAVLDSGVDTLHTDLMPNLLPGYDAYQDSVSNTHGYPTPNYSSDGHGTACAGIVAAVQDNSIGTSGIAPEAQIIPVRIFYYLQYAGNIGVQPFTSTLGLLNGAAYAWRIADCDIMSTSAGLSELFIQALQINTQLIDDEIDSAYQLGRNGLGVAMFFSAGNDDINDVLWPAKLPTTMAVGASDMCDQRKKPGDCSGENWGSTFGDFLDFMAPGVKIATSDMTGANGYANNGITLTFNGTSAACPNAAGVGALVLSANPNLTAEQVRHILSWTAEKVTYNYDSIAALGTWDLQAGYGRINAHLAVALAINTTNVAQNIEEHPIAIMANPSGSIELKNQSSEPQFVELMSTWGQRYCIWVEPHAVYQQPTAPGVYFMRCGGQKSKIVVI